MKARKQQEQKSGTTGRQIDAVPPANEKRSIPNQQQRSPQPEGAPDMLDAPDAPTPPTEQETDKQVIAPDGAPEVKKESEPLF